jgi:hypothetical protein
VLTHKIIGHQITDPLAERSRAFQVREQERQTGDLKPLIYVEGVGPIDVPEGLIGQEPFSGQERAAASEQMVQ